MKSTITATLLGLSTALLMGPAGAGTPDSVTLTKSQGEASVRFHDKLPWRPVGPGTVRYGARLKCQSGCELLLEGGSGVRLHGGAEVTVESPRFEKLGEKVARKVSAIRVEEGSVSVSHGAGAGPTIISARKWSLALFDGRAEVRASETGVAVGIAEARLSLSQGRAWSPLAPHRVHALTEQGTEARAFPTAPSWAASQAIGLAGDAPEGKLSLSWEEGAEAVRVEIAKDEQFHEVVRDERVTENQLPLSLIEGRYWARLAGEDRDGFRSPFGSPLPLRVVRVALPQGGSMPEPGTVVLPPDSSLRFLDVSGLELAVGKGGFVPALRELPLAELGFGLRLRMSGDPASETTLKVEPRTLEANVSFSPIAPIWPEETLTITAKLRDPRGRVDAATIAPKLRIHLAGEEVFTRWTRKGDTFTARIHGRRIEGPQLLRVTVSDEAGRSLGTGLVEVVSSR